MNKKFQDQEALYQRSKDFRDLVLLAGQAFSFEELKTVCAYIIKSGMYKTHKPKGRVMKKHLDEPKLDLLISVTNRLRIKMKTEAQIIEICELSTKNVFWRGYCWNNHGKSPHPKDIFALREVASSFKGYLLLYQYDSLRRSQYIEALKGLALTGEQEKQLNELLSA
ncbi:MAG: hypothetical protein WCO66_01790 [Candidatus Absconditabacteria bacterium]